MSYEDRDGYGVTRPKVIQTPEGTWNFYPKKSAIRRKQMEEGPPPEEQGGGDDFYNQYDPFGEQGSYERPAGPPVDEPQEGGGGGIMGDVDIAGFGNAFDIYGGGGGGRRRGRKR
jgi:hypothetical protein